MQKIQLGRLKDLKIDKSKRETMLILIFGYVLFVFFYYQILLKVKISELSLLVPETKRLTEDIKNTAEDLKHEDILKKRYENMEKEISTYENKLPAEREIPLLLEEVSGMAKDSYVKISAINPVTTSQPQEKDASKVYQRIPILINAKSGYHELGAFINRLEKAKRFMEVSDINIQTEMPNFRRHDVELVVSTYVLFKE